SGTVRSIALDDHGRWAVSAGNSHPDQSVIIWNLTKGTHTRLTGEAQPGYTPLAMAPDGERFLSAHGAEIRVWRVVDGARLAAFTSGAGEVSALAIADDGDCVIAGTTDGAVLRWNLRARDCVIIGRHGTRVAAVAITPDGSWASSITTIDACVWNVAEGTEYQ